MAHNTQSRIVEELEPRISIQRHRLSFDRLHPAALEAWRHIPTAVAGDSMGRTGCMVAAIKALGPGMRILGHARTVSTMIGDNSTLHVAVGLLDPGDILVVDAGGVEDIAVWGGVMTEAALARGVGGAVIDGAIRDAHDLRERGFPVFCRAVSPRGPHKGLGGTIDGSIAAGGVPVEPGDIVIGDADGIAVVPLGRQAEILVGAQKILKREKEWLTAIRSGRSTADLLGLPAPEWVLN